MRRLLLCLLFFVILFSIGKPQTYAACKNPGQACAFLVMPCCSGSSCSGPNIGNVAGLCVANDPGQEGGPCSSSGCGGDCGVGLACVNGQCEADSSCASGPVDVPYSGPEIRSLAAVIGRFYNVLFPASILFGAIFIIKGGYIIMTSEGNPQKTKEGQEDLTAAILGTIFVLLAGAILKIIINQILGVSV